MNAEDKIIQTVVEINEKVTSISVQTTELIAFKEYATNVLDQHTVTLNRLDQERIFTIDRVKRIEDDVERIKLELKIA